MRAPVRQLSAMLAALAAVAVVSSPVPLTASPELVAALNVVRARGCGGRSGAAPPLREDGQLVAAAKAAAGQVPFEDALKASGYRAPKSAMIRVTESSGVKSVADFIAARYCAVLLESAYRDIGIHQQGRDAWIIMAAPFSPPTPEAASAVAARVLELVNRVRTGARLCGSTRFLAARPLSLNATLSRASRAHSADLAQRSVLSHEGRDGSSPADRATRAGYRWRLVGENVASGQLAPDVVVSEWTRSPAHCANLMAPQFTEMGVGYSVNRASKDGIYWVQVFGTPRTAR